MSYRPNYPEPKIVQTSHGAIQALACLHIMKEDGEISFLTDYLAKEVHNLISKIKGWTVATETSTPTESSTLNELLDTVW